MALLEVMTNAAWQPVEAGRANFVVRPDNDSSDPPSFLDAPIRQMVRQQHKSLIPFFVSQCRSLKKSRCGPRACPASRSTIAKQLRGHQYTVGKQPTRANRHPGSIAPGMSLG